MDKRILTLSALTFAVLLAFGNLAAVYAQETSTNEFTLEEITVTAEKRAVNLQTLPSSVVAISAADLTEQGKATTAQILESVPNLVYRTGSGSNPDGNITIRGVQRTQASGGINAILPSTTATYTDGVYQGIGSGYDINRVEVLRGPQGTLYGRSATGGVVSFYTNDPVLSKFQVSGTAEYGTASLINVQAALNAPIGDKVAIRVAGHYYSKDGYFEAEGGKTTTKEGRIKALFQPVDALSVILSASYAETKSNGGGWQSYLVQGHPDTINYKAVHTVVTQGTPNKYRQAAINLNYDFGESTLTYVGGYHDFDNTGLGAEAGKAPNLHRDVNKWPTDYYHSEEIRWASNTKGQLSWLVGANYFRHEFDTSIFSVQTAWAPDPDLPAGDPRGMNAPIFGQGSAGHFLNYGVFTEETFKVNDDFRITAGLRYDKTQLVQQEIFSSNSNVTPTVGNSLIPATFVTKSYRDIENFNNVTYKLRFEYDLTKENMLYLLTATGFMPGFASISPHPFPPPLTFQVLVLDQQKLTSYEMGSKNQFLNNTLRLNGDVFYYKYDGYVEAVNVAASGPPNFVTMPVPLKMYGLELDGEYLITMDDKLSLNLGLIKTKITDLPMFGTFNSKNFMALTDLPGNPSFKATLSYDHTFVFGNGSALAPRAQVRYTGDSYISQMSQAQVALGEKPYNHQSAFAIVDLGATWTSSDQKISANAYLRNALDKEYKAGISLVNNLALLNVTPGDPRTFGVSISVKF
jgi:outer membrane receptor protein involved in Fe transport